MCIKGGYILQPRIIDESKISGYPPHVREIWLYLLRKANHKDMISYGVTIKRGQLKTSYRGIISDLSWFVGYRKESYKKHHCETAMKLLVKEQMVTITKTTRGMVVTICNYDYYQDPKNYETDSETYNETTTEPQSTDTINKNEKNGSNIDTKVSTSNEQAHSTQNDGIDYKNLIDYFNQKTNGVFREARYPISEKRKAMIRARIREHGKEAFAEMIHKAVNSNFLKGDNKSGFVANFDWMIRPDNFQKIIEGNYSNNQTHNDSLLTYDQVTIMVHKGELTFDQVVKVQTEGGKVYWKRK